jgi:SAM-dependent methyltransferase
MVNAVMLGMYRSRRLKMAYAIKKMIPKPIRSRIKQHYPLVTHSIQNIIGWFRHVIPDTFEVIIGKRDSLTPPHWMNFVGPGDFKEIGKEFYRYFIQYGKLKPHEQVLEVGCGLGRMAIPLMNYLKEEQGGSYDGFDIVPKGIQWCRKKITPIAPHFQFQLADIYNYGYNPGGKFLAADFRFPYDDDSFDFVLLTSVFTHMLPRDMEHYLEEISRVLKKEGRCLITYFLLNSESQQAIDAGTSNIEFSHRMAGFPQNRIKDPYVPEAAVAYPEDYIKRLYEKNHLEISPPIYYGSWSGRKVYTTFQDMIISGKR